MGGEHILIVEDEEDILELITYNLAKEKYQVHGVMSGEEALAYAQANRPDLILLDLMLPGMDGFEVCRRLKGDRLTSALPVVMLTAKGEEADIVSGLELGADDYIVKPFSPRVLLARLRAVLRRESRRGEAEDLIVRGPLTIDNTRHQVLLDGRPIQLTSTEFRILYFLAARPGWVFSRDQIVNAIHQTDFAVTARAVDVQIVGLRKKLAAASVYIETVRGVGYRFKE